MVFQVTKFPGTCYSVVENWDMFFFLVVIIIQDGDCFMNR